MASREGPLKDVSRPREGEFLFDLDAGPSEESDLKKVRSADFLRLKEAARSRSGESHRSAHPEK